MPSTNFICRHHAVTHYVSCARSFDFFCFRFSIFTICICCCCVHHFRLYFHFFTFCLRCGFFLRRRFFKTYFFDDLLVSFSSSMFFCLDAILMLYFFVFSIYSLVMAVFSRRGDRESCHDTSVVTSHVDHVVGLGVFIVSQVSSLG